MGKRERIIFIDLLKQYPVLSEGHFSNVPGRKASGSPIDEKVLEEALAETRKENKARVAEFLNASGRFAEEELGFRFTIKRAELEWLLQILNDIRVGYWVALGSPDPKHGQAMKFTEENAHSVVAMDMASYYESWLLGAVSTEE